MPKTRGSSGPGYGEGQPVLTLDQVRDLIRGLDETNPCQTLLEKLLNGVGELRSIRSLLPSPRPLEERQVKELARVRAEGARLADRLPFESDESDDYPTKQSL